MRGLHGPLRLRADGRRGRDAAAQHRALRGIGLRPLLKSQRPDTKAARSFGEVAFDAIFVARGPEERAVRRALRGHSRPVVWTSGIGGAAAKRAVAQALAEGPPATALVTGLCGLLSPSYAVGDLLVYATVTRADGATMSCDAALAAQLAQTLHRAQTGIAAYASESIVARSADKRALAQRCRVAAVDMESFAFVEGLQRAGSRVAVLRVGSDGVAEDLPDLSRGVDADGTLRSSALALALLSNPLAGARLAANGLRALGELERALRLIVTTA